MWLRKIIDIVTQIEITGSLGHCVDTEIRQVFCCYHRSTFHYLTAPSGLLFGLGWRGGAAASTKAGTRHRVSMVVVVLCLTATILQCLYIIQMLV